MCCDCVPRNIVLFFSRCWRKIEMFSSLSAFDFAGLYGKISKPPCAQAAQDGTQPPLEDIVVGGGVVESYAFLSTKAPTNPQQQGGRRAGFASAELQDPPGILSLQDAMGMSSAVLGIVGVPWQVGIHSRVGQHKSLCYACAVLYAWKASRPANFSEAVIFWWRFISSSCKMLSWLVLERIDPSQRIRRIIELSSESLPPFSRGGLKMSEDIFFAYFDSILM